MKIYSVESDVNRYHWLMPEETGEKLLSLTTSDCNRRWDTWTPPFVSVLNKGTTAADFLHFDTSSLLVSPDALRLVRPFFQVAGELLPLWFDGEQYTLLNITNCVNALDDAQTDWLRAKDGSKVEIRKHGFDPGKLNASSLFKIPETCRGSVLTWEKTGDPETEFKACVEQNGLTGLLFQELWDSGD